MDSMANRVGLHVGQDVPPNCRLLGLGVPSSLNTKGQDAPSKDRGYYRSHSVEGDIHFCPDLPEQALLLANKRRIIRNIEHTFQNTGFQ